MELLLTISKLKEEFKIVVKKADYFLGLDIKQSDGNIKLNPQAYAKGVLEFLYKQAAERDEFEGRLK